MNSAQNERTLSQTERMTYPTDALVSCWKGVTDTSSELDMTFSGFVELIRSTEMQHYVLKLRKYLHEGDQARFDKNKKKLTAVTHAGVFGKGRKNDALQNYTGIVVLDLDKLSTEQVAQYQAVLRKEPLVLLMFVSPSGKGLKVFGWHQGGPEEHEAAYYALRNHVQALLNCNDVYFDDVVRNLSRLTFASYDPDAHYHPAAPAVQLMEQPATLLDAASYVIREPAGHSQSYAEAVLRNAADKIRNAPEGQKHVTRRDQAHLVAGYVADRHLDEAEAYGVLREAALSNTIDPKLALKDLTDGFEHGKGRPLSPPPREPTLQTKGPEIQKPAEDADKPASLFLSFDDFVANLKPPEYLVEDMMETDTLLTLIGEPGSGKSFLALSWGLSISTGLDWQDRPVRQGNVYYFLGEGNQGFGRRMMAWKERHGKSPQNAFRILQGGWNLTSVEKVQELYDGITADVNQNGRPSLIIIDTLARHFGAENENDTQAMNAFVGYVDLIRRTYQCSVLIVHHTGKDKDKGGRGSSVLHAAVDASYFLDKAENGTMTLKCLKMKDGEMPAHQFYQLMSVQVRRPDGYLLVQDDGSTPVTSAVLVPSEEPVEINVSTKEKGPKESEKLAYEAFLELWETGKQNLLSSGRSLQDLTVDAEQWSQLCQSKKYGLSKYTVSDIKQNKRDMYNYFNSEVMVHRKHLMKMKLNEVGQ